MKRHLRFIARERGVLRLRLNAAEDLLVNGAREPEHRGKCMHLLSKVDKACVDRALERSTDPRARSRLLAGVVRFSTDLGILILYLESLVDVASKRDAAAAFSMAVARMDFEALSSARMERVLQLLAEVFVADHERAQVVFGLLQSGSFRAALQSARGRLPAELQGHFGALRAVHEVVIEGRDERVSPSLLARGVQVLLAAPDEALKVPLPAPKVAGFPRSASAI